MTHGTIPKAAWRKSSYSQNNGGECIEWAPTQIAAMGGVPVRDSNNPNGPTLTFTPSAWTSFVTAVKNNGLTS